MESGKVSKGRTWGKSRGRTNGQKSRGGSTSRSMPYSSSPPTDESHIPPSQTLVPCPIVQDTSPQLHNQSERQGPFSTERQGPSTSESNIGGHTKPSPDPVDGKISILPSGDR